MMLYIYPIYFPSLFSRFFSSLVLNLGCDVDIASALMPKIIKKKRDIYNVDNE